MLGLHGLGDSTPVADGAPVPISAAAAARPARRPGRADEAPTGAAQWREQEEPLEERMIGLQGTLAGSHDGATGALKQQVGALAHGRSQIAARRADRIRSLGRAQERELTG